MMAVVVLLYYISWLPILAFRSVRAVKNDNPCVDKDQMAEDG